MIVSTNENKFGRRDAKTVCPIFGPLCGKRYLACIRIEVEHQTNHPIRIG